MIDSFAILSGWVTEHAKVSDASRPAVAFRRLAARLWLSAKAARRLRRARRQLLALDDRLLRDAGISRQDIDAVIDDLALRNNALGAWR